MSLGILRHTSSRSQTRAGRWAAPLWALIIVAGCSNGSPFSLAGTGSACGGDTECASGFCQGGSCGDSAGNPLGGQVCAADADCRGLLCDPSARRCVACGQGGRKACPPAPDGGVAFFDVSSPFPGSDAGRVDATGFRDRGARDSGERDISVTSDVSIGMDVVFSDLPSRPDLVVVADVINVADVATTCSANCMPNETCCNGKCVDTSTDSTHCGDCATSCPTTNSCVGGLCCSPAAAGQGCCVLVPASTNLCCFDDPTVNSTTCVISGLGQQCTITAPAKATCGKQCGGATGGICDLPTACCGLQCVDLTTNQNCGSCGCTCPADTLCHQGQCTGPAQPVACTQTM